MSTENKIPASGYCRLNEQGEVVEKHETQPRPPKNSAAAESTASKKKKREPKETPAGAETNTGEQQP